jgi:hypothetical protein
MFSSDKAPRRAPQAMFPPPSFHPTSTVCSFAESRVCQTWLHLVPYYPLDRWNAVYLSYAKVQSRQGGKGPASWTDPPQSSIPLPFPVPCETSCASPHNTVWIPPAGNARKLARWCCYHMSFLGYTPRPLIPSAFPPPYPVLRSLKIRNMLGRHQTSLLALSQL